MAVPSTMAAGVPSIILAGFFLLASFLLHQVLLEYMKRKVLCQCLSSGKLCLLQEESRRTEARRKGNRKLRRRMVSSYPFKRKGGEKKAVVLVFGQCQENRPPIP